MTIQTLLISISIIMTGCVVAQHPIAHENKNPGPVQVLYASDFGTKLMVDKRKFGDSSVNHSMGEIIKQVGEKTFGEILNGVGDSDMPCALSLLCSGRKNLDTLNIRFARLSLYRVATYNGYNGKGKNRSILRLGNLPDSFGSKPLFIIMDSRYLVPIKKERQDVIIPLENLRSVTISKWEALALQPPKRDHAYWFGEDEVSEVPRNMVVSRQTGSEACSRVWAQVGRMGKLKTYLPEEIRSLSIGDAGIKKQLEGVKLYYIASYDHDIVSNERLRYAILKMPYLENAGFFRTPGWNLDIYFFIEEQFISVDGWYNKN